MMLCRLQEMPTKMAALGSRRILYVLPPLNFDFKEASSFQKWTL
jgi:hypothetical protein